MNNVKSEELERFLEILKSEVSAFLKLCTICKQKFKDTLDKRSRIRRV